MNRGFAPILIMIIVAVSIIGAVVYQQIKPKTTAPNSSTPLGPQTDAFLDRALESLFNGPPPTGPMSVSTLSPCDFNADGKCDSGDFDLFKQSLGTRRGERGYSPLADLDADGVVTATDEQILLKLFDENLSADTANWKTYTNSMYRFSMKYPPDWQFFESSRTSVHFFPPGISPGPDSIHSISLDVIDRSYAPPLPAIQNQSPSDYTKLRTVTLNGNKADILKPNTKSGEQYFVKTSQGKYDIYFYFGLDLDRKYDQIFDQILSTFKFVE